MECAGGGDCYSIIVEAPNCDVELPKGTCTSDTTKYVNGSYTLSVKPKEGFTYQGKTSKDTATGYQVKINEADATAKINCVTASACPKTATARVGVGVVPLGNGSYMLNENANINITGGDVLDVDVTVYATANMYIDGSATPQSTASFTCSIPARQNYGRCSIDNLSSGYASGANLTVSGSITRSKPDGCVTGSLGPY